MANLTPKIPQNQSLVFSYFNFELMGLLLLRQTGWREEDKFKILKKAIIIYFLFLVWQE
jgi:hypothetical protein